SRLDWIESIARIKDDRKLFEIRYNFDAQRPLDYPGLVATGAAELVVSRLKLDMLLLHEGDLLNFLADLQAGIKAHVSVRPSTVTRLTLAPAPGQYPWSCGSRREHRHSQRPGVALRGQEHHLDQRGSTGEHEKPPRSGQSDPARRRGGAFGQPQDRADARQGPRRGTGSRGE